MLDSTYPDLVILSGVCACTGSIECSGGRKNSAGFTFVGSVTAKFTDYDHKYLFINDKYVFCNRDTRPV